ncbi:hypothetical protein, partial [Streptococcus pseudopneumoniae]
ELADGLSGMCFTQEDDPILQMWSRRNFIVGIVDSIQCGQSAVADLSKILASVFCSRNDTEFAESVADVQKKILDMEEVRADNQNVK